MTDYTNLKYANDLGGIQAERTSDGVSEYFAPQSKNHKQAVVGVFGPIEAYVAPPEPTPGEPLQAKRGAASLDRMTFALRAAEAGYVTYDAAAQWAAGNSAPPPLQAAIDALPEAERGPALVQVLGAANIRRNNELMPLIIAAFKTDDAGADALYGIE